MPVKRKVRAITSEPTPNGAWRVVIQWNVGEPTVLTGTCLNEAMNKLESVLREAGYP